MLIYLHNCFNLQYMNETKIPTAQGRCILDKEATFRHYVEQSNHSIHGKEIIQQRESTTSLAEITLPCFLAHKRLTPSPDLL